MNQPDPTRPRELALLLLAASGRPPRERARDQQADRAGMQLRQQILERLIELDPDVEQLEATLLRIVDEMGPPTGPTRAVAMHVRDELHAAACEPGFIEHLLGDAIHAAADRRGKKP